MIEWWTNLEPEGMKTFVGIGMFSSAILFIQMLIVLAGGYLDVPDLDFDIAEAGEGGATGMFSIRGIGSFFTGFGWTGASVLDAGGSLWLAIAAAIVVGLCVLFGFVSMMRWLQSLREEGNINYKNAIGQVGSVYVPIPPNREGLGQIEVKVQSRVSTVRAVSDHSERLENRVAVRVTELVDDRTLLVEKLK
jgi:membrane protein implicated in regulation of membrane protease activity